MTTLQSSGGNSTALLSLGSEAMKIMIKSISHNKESLLTAVGSMGTVLTSKIIL
uniref:Uncharacterized protein n=1 Tax=Arundo donax TaxID=35708 RepID=A0A0A9HT26_ARUDO